jgi:ketosteroid isomerase-like protein
MSSPEDDPTRLLIQLACRDTVDRAAHLADLPDPAGLAALFTADAVLQRPSGDTLVGRAAIQAAYAARPAQRLTRHLVAGTVVDLLPSGEARALSSVLLCSGSLDDTPGPQGRPMRGPPVVGEFDDLLRREADGRWRIAHRTARFLLHQADPG